MENGNFIKGLIVAVGTFISTKFGFLAPLLFVYVISQGIDYGTGILSASYEGLNNPGDPTKGLNSKIGIKGIIKKVGYLVVVVVSIMLDYVITNASIYIGIDLGALKNIIPILVLVWLFLNECISILENVSKINDKLPPFLLDIIKSSKEKVENKAKINKEA